MIVQQRCFCGAVEEMALSEEEARDYSEWRAGRKYIQELKLTPCEREFLKTGLCRNCQQEIFGNSETDRIQAVE